jgi:hypothetical protein
LHGCRNGIGCDGVNQSNTESFRRCYLFRSNKHLQSPAFPDQARQALRPSPSSNQAQSRAAMTEDRVRRCDSPVTSQG